jgi:hypothetical protein
MLQHAAQAHPVWQALRCSLRAMPLTNVISANLRHAMALALNAAVQMQPCISTASHVDNNNGIAMQRPDA